MKQWCHYKVLVRRLGGFWMPDDTEGNQDRYESRKEAITRAFFLAGAGEQEVEVHQMTDTVIYRLPQPEPTE